MTSSRIAAVLGLVALAVLARADSAGDAYKSLAKEYDDALAAYQKAFGAAKTDEERAKVLRDRHPNVASYAKKFMAMASEHPDNTAAVDSLVWVVLHPMDSSLEEAALRDKALLLLGKSHADDDRVGSLCTRLVQSIDVTTEKFLREVHQKAKKKPVKARAAASLAVNLRHRARLIPALEKNAAARKQYEAALGKAVVTALLAQDAKKLRAESEKLFEEVEEKFGDLPHPTHGKLEDYAKRNLLAMRKPVETDRLAPVLSGEDVNGKKLTLADHKGSVVLLDFWADSFAPSRAKYEYERGLVKRLANKPFVLLGVNGDFDREALKKTMAKEKITWRSFFDGGGPGGPIATRWDVEVWPTILLIDHKGIVRHVFVGWPEAKKLDGLIDGLVSEALKSP